MPADSWRNTKSKMNLEFEEIKKFVPDYDYLDKAKSIATDEKMCDLFVEGLRTAKSRLFDIIELCYEIHHEEMNKELQKLKDDVDIFSDEIKARYCEWGMNQDFLEKLIRHDYELLRGLQKINNDLKDFYERIIKSRKLIKTDHYIEVEPESWERLKKKTLDIKNQIIEMVRTFKEREVICNIKGISLERTFERIKEDIEKKI